MDDGPNLRNNHRIPHKAEIQFENFLSGTFYNARMYNYSLQGMYFESDLALLPGARVNLWLSDLPQNSLPEVNAAEVRWSEEIAGAVVLYNYGAGIRFNRSAKHSDLPRQFELIQGGMDPTEPSETS